MINLIISTNLILDENGEICSKLEKNWIDFFPKNKVSLLTLPFQSAIKLKKVNINGIILSGGNSLFKYQKNILNKYRDINDEILLKYGIKNKLPIFATCRGFQFIVDYYGGILKKTNNHLNKFEKIKVIDDSFIKKKNIIVNSYHNFAAYNLPKNFKAIGVSEVDNSIEIATCKKNKILMTMFHPERKIIDKNILKKMIFKHFGII